MTSGFPGSPERLGIIRGPPIDLLTLDSSLFHISSTLAFPPYSPERTLPLAGERVRIGRQSSVELELDDPGVSHLHAVLLAREGGWLLVDPGSTNGTTLNGSDDELPVNIEVPVTDGDRIHVGAWTTIVLRKST